MNDSDFHQRLYLSSFLTQTNQSPFSAVDDVELDRHFHFSNDEDFCNKPQLEGFLFPSNSPDLNLLPLPSTPRYLMSPVRKFTGTGSNLNSPIRLKSKKSISSVHSPHLFLMENNTTNDENIPDAVIDLDEILNANMHIADGNDNDLDACDRFQDDFLASPFTKSILSHFQSSSYSSSYLKQAIHELAPDAIEEEDDLDEYKLATEDIIDEQSEDTAVLDENDILESNSGTGIFENPQDTFSGVYLTLSANSSNSSLPSSGGCPSQRFPFISLIEKTTSNSSKDSGASTFFSNTGTSTKRSSAKASRYQSFYDQSFKISSALKHSSFESIHLVSSQNTENANSTSVDYVKADTIPASKVLGHSSSLPSLKANVKRPVPLRYSETRVKRDTKNSKPGMPLMSKPGPSHDQLMKNISSLTALMGSPLKPNDVQSVVKQKKSILVPSQAKNLSNSPSSLLSEYSCTMNSTADVSTDYSSVISHGEGLATCSKSTPSESSRSTTPVIVVSMENEAHSAVSATSDLIPQANSSLYCSTVESKSKDLSETLDHDTFSGDMKQTIHKLTAFISGKGSRAERGQSSDLPKTLIVGPKPVNSGNTSREKDETGSLHRHTRKKSDRFSAWFRKGRN